METGEALYLEARALVLDVSLQIRHENALLHLVLTAAMQNLDLTKHLSQDFVLNGSENTLDRSLTGQFARIFLLLVQSINLLFDL